MRRETLSAILLAKCEEYCTPYALMRGVGLIRVLQFEDKKVIFARRSRGESISDAAKLGMED